MQLPQLRVASDQRFLDQARSPSAKTKMNSPMRCRRASGMLRSSPLSCPACERSWYTCLRCHGNQQDADRLNPPLCALSQEPASPSIPTRRRAS
jgi:hypothetical protein